MSRWERDLEKIREESMTRTSCYEASALSDFKNKYPGNYTIEWAYDSKKGYFTLQLLFERDEEKMWWLIKNS